MLRITPSQSAAGAQRYFEESLRKADYYIRGQEVEAKWHGKALSALGLSEGAAVSDKEYKALVFNKHPLTGKQITPRMNKEANRIPGWDFTFSVPKSYSVLQAISGDSKLLDIFRESVAQTMAIIEQHVATRVRIGGKQEDRVTGNFAWCDFLHTTTRPVDGVPDPHLHIHAYVFNFTLDAFEEKLKAAKIRAIKDNAYFYEALFNSILTGKLAENSYPVERTVKGWEIAGLNLADFIRKFSRRTAEIEKLAEELGITDPKVKSKLGATTRAKKDKGLKQEDLVKEWKSRLTADELAAMNRVLEHKINAPKCGATVGDALDYAHDKHFERASVVEKNRIVASALKFGVGAVSLSDVEAEMKHRGFIEREIDGQLKVTTPALVLEEARLIQQVRSGLGAKVALHAGRLKFINDGLSKEQKAAVSHLLKSNDQIMALRGYAGTGKTTLLKEFRAQLEGQGIRLVALAPSADASRGVLRDEGFKGANTIARFLVDKELQRKARGHVVLIDEAGLIGNRDMERLLDIVGPSTRIVLSGDVGQNPPVSRGNFLALLESYSGLDVFTVREIHRQQEASYRKTVEAMAERDLATVFSRLEAMGAIEEIADDAERYRRGAVEYVQCLNETGIPPLVVSPTHAEAREAVSHVRALLKEIGHLGVERKFLQYRDLKWEEAEKLLPENYEMGLMVQFHQHAPGGIKRGCILPVLGMDGDRRVLVESPDKQKIALDLSKADRFRVFAVSELPLAPGDRVKVTRGGQDLNGRRLENGKVSSVKSICKDGKLTLANGWKLNSDFGHLEHAYDTAYSSQGKKAPESFVFQSARSSKAASSEAFYVAISRGEQRLRIFTDDVEKLQEAVGKSARRISALEFTGLGEELFMKDGITGQEWTKRISEGKAWRQDKAESFIRKLAAERKLDSQEKLPTHVAFLEMQKAKMGSDGRSRSKGRPDSSKQRQKGMVRDPRGNEKETPAKDLQQGVNSKEKHQARPAKELQEPKKTPPKSSLFKHVENAISASAKNLREVLEHTKRGAEAIKDAARRNINFGNIKTKLSNLQNNPKTREAQVKYEATRKPPTPKPPTPTPTIRRGR